MQDSEMPLNDDYFKDATYDSTERTSHLPAPASIEIYSFSKSDTTHSKFSIRKTPYDVRHPRIFFLTYFNFNVITLIKPTF